MSEQVVTEQSSPVAVEEDEISLLDLLIVLAKHKWEILGITLAAAAIAVAVVLQMPAIYTANVKLLPPQRSQSTASAILSQLGGGGGGIAELTGSGTKNDTFLAMLKSESVADKLIQRFELQTVYGGKYLADVRKSLAERSNIISSKDGVIRIEVDDEDPVRAAAIANGYVDELKNMLLRFAMTEAAQRRMFFEQQLKQEKDKLTDAQLAVDRTPRTSLNFLEVMRTFKYREGIYEILAKQYETARLDEAKDAPMIQVLDKAVPPEKKSKPNRRPAVMLSALAGFIAAILLAFFREAVKRARANPDNVERLSLLRRSLWGR